MAAIAHGRRHLLGVLLGRHFYHRLGKYVGRVKEGLSAKRPDSCYHLPVISECLSPW